MKEPHDSPAAVYAHMLPGLTASARQCGYALAVHGSMQRDLDLIAVPWVDDVTSAEALVEVLLATSGGRLIARPGWEADGSTRSHGRRVWSIYLGGRPYIDLSVMPRIEKEHPL